jgi:hypothetical protein
VNNQETFQLKLREAARTTSHKDYADALRWAADKIENDVRLLLDEPNEINLRALNGTWAYAQRILDKLPPEPDPQAPLAGSPKPARLAA